MLRLVNCLSAYPNIVTNFWNAASMYRETFLFILYVILYFIYYSSITCNTLLCLYSASYLYSCNQLNRFSQGSSGTQKFLWKSRACSPMHLEIFMLDSFTFFFSIVAAAKRGTTLNNTKRATLKVTIFNYNCKIASLWSCSLLSARFSLKLIGKIFAEVCATFQWTF